MTDIVFQLPDGSVERLRANPGETVRDVAIRNGLPGILGECGGACACGTCHIRIGSDWRSQVSPRSQEEAVVLELTPNADGESRLGCQIRMSLALDGLVVEIPLSSQ